MRIVPLVGNPQPGSRTRLVAEEVAQQIAVRVGGTVQPTVDLADLSDRLFTIPDAAVDTISAAVAGCEVVVVATPTYKASYTGLLKAFLDRYGNGGLRGVVAIPVMTIGSPAHTLAPDFTLRPLLVELGASVPTASIAFPTASIDERGRIVSEWLETASDALSGLQKGSA